MSQDRREVRGVAGIDEAGRGPMFGPMVICGVLFREENMAEVESLCLKDSKVLSPKRRENLDKAIRGLAWRIQLDIVTAAEIDSLRESGYTMNEIETLKFASIVMELRPKTVFMDAADVNAKRFGRLVAQRSGLERLGTTFISEHKADAKYPVVSAAAIVAKVERDSHIARLREQYGDIGSGYPSDPKSIAFVKRLLLEGELPRFVRRTWASIDRLRMQVSKGQTRIDDFTE